MAALAAYRSGVFMSAVDVVGPQGVPQLQAQVEQIIAEARKQGASACEVAVSVEQGLSTTVRQGEVETVEFNRDQGFGITLYVGHRKGSASTSASGEAAIRETVAAALAIAKHASEDECAGLADAGLMARELPQLDLYHAWSITPEQAIEQALSCEAAAFAADARIKNADGTTLNTHQGCRVYGNSHGFVSGYASTRHSLSCVMIAEANGQMQRDYWYDVNRQGELLADAGSIGRRAAERAVSRLGARPVPTCEVPVLFSAELAGGLFGSFLAAISGGNLYRKSSFLEGTLGQQLFPAWMKIDERPHIPRALGSAAFDGDGLATYAKSFVERGELLSYVLGTYSGRKLGMPSTANAGGVHNLFVSHGDEDLQALLKRMGRGLLVTELMGQGLNMVTGDYSRGAGGYWVENGEIQFPVQEVTIAGNLRDMFKQIVAVGSDLELRSNIRTGSVLIERMTVAGS
jgi:PmbA protein